VSNRQDDQEDSAVLRSSHFGTSAYVSLSHGQRSAERDLGQARAAPTTRRRKRCCVRHRPHKGFQRSRGAWTAHSNENKARTVCNPDASLDGISVLDELRNFLMRRQSPFLARSEIFLPAPGTCARSSNGWVVRVLGQSASSARRSKTTVILHPLNWTPLNLTGARHAECLLQPQSVTRLLDM